MSLSELVTKLPSINSYVNIMYGKFTRTLGYRVFLLDYSIDDIELKAYIHPEDLDTDNFLKYKEGMKGTARVLRMQKTTCEPWVLIDLSLLPDKINQRVCHMK